MIELDRDILSRFGASGASTHWLGRGRAELRPIRARLHAMRKLGWVEPFGDHWSGRIYAWRITDAGRRALEQGGCQDG